MLQKHLRQLYSNLIFITNSLPVCLYFSFRFVSAISIKIQDSQSAKVEYRFFFFSNQTFWNGPKNLTHIRYLHILTCADLCHTLSTLSMRNSVLLLETLQLSTSILKKSPQAVKPIVLPRKHTRKKTHRGTFTCFFYIYLYRIIHD